MAIKVFWGGRRTGKTTHLRENVNWSTSYIGHDWRRSRELYAGINCQPYHRGVEIPPMTKTLLLDDVEMWPTVSLFFMLEQAEEWNINVFLTFTPPVYRLPKTHLLVHLARLPEAEWLGSSFSPKGFLGFSIPDRERFKRELSKWHYKSQMEGKLLLGADTNRP